MLLQIATVSAKVKHALVGLFATKRHKTAALLWPWHECSQSLWMAATDHAVCSVTHTGCVLASVTAGKNNAWAYTTKFVPGK